MDIKTFVKSLLPSNEKETVMEDARITRTELRDVTIPLYDSSIELFKVGNLHSTELKEMSKTFLSLAGAGGNQGMFVAIQHNLPVALKNLDDMAEMIKRTYNDDVMASGLTYLKANMLQFVELVGFVSKYARKLLNYAYVLETAQHAKDDSGAESSSITKAEIDWVKFNFVAFCNAFRIVTGKSSDVKRNIDNIPDIVVTDEGADNLRATVGMAKIDPFNMGLISARWNPIFHISVRIAEWQVTRYKRAQEEMRMIQLRKIHLERTIAGNPDARIEKELEYLTERVNKLNYKLSEMEKDL